MSKNEEFDMTRSPVPNTDILKASIIAEAESLPQYLELAKSPAKSEKSWFRIIRVALPLAACCVFALLMFISPDNWTDTKPELNSSLVSNEDSDWQEIMRLEDEWLLAEL